MTLLCKVGGGRKDNEMPLGGLCEVTMCQIWERERGQLHLGLRYPTSVAFISWKEVNVMGMS